MLFTTRLVNPREAVHSEAEEHLKCWQFTCFSAATQLAKYHPDVTAALSTFLIRASARWSVRRDRNMTILS